MMTDIANIVVICIEIYNIAHFIALNITNRKKKERKEMEEALNARVATADSNTSFARHGSQAGLCLIRCVITGIISYAIFYNLLI